MTIYEPLGQVHPLKRHYIKRLLLLYSLNKPGKVNNDNKFSFIQKTLREHKT